MSQQANLMVVVRNRQGVMFDGEARSVTGFNSRGQFDVLASHANFISVISKKLVVRTNKGKTEEFKVDSGVIRVVNDRVEVFVGVR